MSTEHSTEKLILMAMRKTLARIVRDLTPHATATTYPLSEGTVEDIKKCFDLIAAREREMMQDAGLQNQDRPHFIDEERSSNVVKMSGISKKESA
jgi:hypothetical protein